MKRGISEKMFIKYPKELLIREYIENQKSFRQMNKEYGINGRTMSKLLSFYGLPIRYGTDAIKTQRAGDKGGKRRKKTNKNRKYKIITNDGYYAVLFDGDHKGKSRGRVKEHILIMEDLIGRRLEDGEIVHHIDGNKLNNLPSNLQLMKARDHNKLHYKERGIDKKTGRFIY